MTDSTATATPKTTPKVFPSQSESFRILWNVSSQVTTELEPQIQKLIFAKEMLIFADMKEAMIQDCSDDTLSGLIILISDVISTFHTFNNNISKLYKTLEVANG